MKAIEAGKIARESYKNVNVEPLLEIIYEQIKKKAQGGGFTLYNPFNCLPEYPSPVEKRAIREKIEENGFRFERKKASSPNGLSFFFYSIHW